MNISNNVNIGAITTLPTPSSNQSRISHWHGQGAVTGVLQRQGGYDSSKWGVALGSYFMRFMPNAAARVHKAHEESMAKKAGTEPAKETLNADRFDTSNVKWVEEGLEVRVDFTLDSKDPMNKLGWITATVPGASDLYLDKQTFEQQPFMQPYGHSFRNFLLQYAERGHFPAPRIETNPSGDFGCKAPATVWLDVARFLPVADKKSLRLVNHAYDVISAASVEHVRMRTMGDLEGLHRFPAAKKMTLSGGEITEVLLQGALRINPDITELDLRDCPRLTNTALQHIAQSLPNLTHLTLKKCPLISGAGLQHVGGMTRLTHLTLTHCPKVNEKGLQHVGRMTGLIHLDLSACHNITSQAVAHLARLTNLTHLNLSTCPNITDDGILHVAQLGKLRHLDLKSCRGLTNACMQHIGTMHSLTRLSLSHCTSIGDAGMGPLSNLTQLSHLDLNYCPAITDAGTSHLRGLTGLTHLDLGYCEQITDDTLAHIGNMTRLASLNLSNCDNITNRGLEKLAPLSDSLTHLSLRKCEKLTNPSVQALRRFINLTYLNMSRCKLNDKALRHFFPEPKKNENFGGNLPFSRLKHLDLSDCSQIESTASLYRLSHLEEVNLEDCRKLNDLSGLANLHNLKSVNLENCQGLGNNRASLGCLQNLWLTQLNISGCGLRSDQMEPLETMTSLQSLHAGNQTFPSDTLKYIGKLINLKELHLPWTCISRNNVQNLQNLTDLRKLDLSYSKIFYDEVVPEQAQARQTFLANMKKLTSLKFGYCEHVAQGDLAFLPQLRNLQYLDLSRCDLMNNEVLNQFAQQSVRVNKLYLKNCKSITNDAVNALLNLPGLTNLNVAYTGIDPIGAERLKRNIPSVSTI